MSKTKRALELLDASPGMTPYEASKQAGCSSSIVYRALAIRNRRRLTPKCPTCGQIIKSTNGEIMKTIGKNGFYTIIRKSDRQYLHIQRFDELGNTRLTPVSINSWVAMSREQAIAQAAFVGDGFTAAFVADAQPPHTVQETQQ